MSDVTGVASAQLAALVRRPAVWTIVAAMAVLNQVFSYLIPYLGYRTAEPAEPGSFRSGETPAELLASTLPDQLVPNTLGGFPIFAGALALAFGALVFGSEYGWGTLKTLFTQRPSRSSVLGGQLLAMVGWIVGSVVALFALNAVTGVLIAAGEGESLAFPSAGHLLTGVAGGTLILSVWASIGAVLSVAFRSVALPIGLGIVWALGIENLVSAMADSMLSALDPVRDILPGVNAGSLVAAVSTERIGEAAPGVSTTVGQGQALVTLCVYAAVCAAIALWTYRRRDVT